MKRADISPTKLRQKIGKTKSPIVNQTAKCSKIHLRWGMMAYGRGHGSTAIKDIRLLISPGPFKSLGECGEVGYRIVRIYCGDGKTGVIDINSRDYRTGEQVIYLPAALGGVE